MSIEATGEVIADLNEDLTWTTIKVLLRADDLLAGYGWIQGKYTSRKGFCAIGAVHAAIAEIPIEQRVLVGREAIATVAELVADQVTIPATCTGYLIPEGMVTRWNDMSGRTAEDVRQAFQRAALLLQDGLP